MGLSSASGLIALETDFLHIFFSSFQWLVNSEITVCVSIHFLFRALFRGSRFSFFSRLMSSRHKLILWKIYYSCTSQCIAVDTDGMHSNAFFLVFFFGTHQLPLLFTYKWMRVAYKYFRFSWISIFFHRTSFTIVIQLQTIIAFGGRFVLRYM